MNLKTVIDKLNEISLKQPAIRQYIKSGNVYDLNKDRNARFGVFCCTQGTHTSNISEGYNTYNFYLYYIDRLKSDDTNKIDIQSTGLEVLKNIVRVFKKENDVYIDTLDFTVFTERFSELCAGCYATISIIIYDDNCTEIYE